MDGFLGFQAAVAGDELPTVWKSHSIFRLACRDMGAHTMDLPVLMIRSASSPSRLYLDFLSFARQQVSEGQRFQSLQRAAVIVGLLVDYASTVVRGPIASQEDVEGLLLRFLGHRFQGTTDFDGVDHTGLGWTPVQWTTVCEDRRRLVAFLNFCLARHRHYPDFRGGAVSASVSEIPGTMLLRLRFRKADLLSHLARHRTSFHPPPRLTLPGSGPPAGARRHGGTSKGGSIPIEEATRLIMLTSNPVHKAVFILMHFGGPRLSEILQLWPDDVLPAPYAPKLFQGARISNGPLVILAHPTESTWVGEVGNYTRTRLAYLDALGQKPRVLLRQRDSRRAGWKGMVFDNESLKISLVTWADPYFATMFSDLHHEILDRRQRISAARGHPYLFVCLDDRQAEFGLPMKVAGMRKAYYAACTRAGLEPHRNHATPHRARGSYDVLLKGIGLDAEERSKLLHQSRASSERPYGRDITATHRVLKEHFERTANGGT